MAEKCVEQKGKKRGGEDDVAAASQNKKGREDEMHVRGADGGV